MALKVKVNDCHMKSFTKKSPENMLLLWAFNKLLILVYFFSGRKEQPRGLSLIVDDDDDY